MSGFSIRGIIPCLLTPFTVSGEPDLSLLASEVRHLDETGVDALCVGGVAAEMAGSTPAEFGRICNVVVQATTKPVIAAVYPDSTVEAVELTRAAVSAGAQALLLAQPHYLFQPDLSGLEEMFRAVRREIHVPLLLSNSLATAPLDMTAVKRLSEAGLIDGVHEGAGDPHLLTDLLAADPRLPVLTGIEALMYVAFLLGAEGAIVSLAAVFPEDCVAMYAAVRRGDHVEARLIHERLNRLWRALDHPVEFVARLKFACSEQGRPAGRARSPYDWLPPASEGEVRRALAADGKL
jgi:4-hydroxy-tetrahydrodipicolinate synthase